MKETTSIYSPHVLILEGIFALYDQRVLDLLDMKVSRTREHFQPTCDRTDLVGPGIL